VNRSLTEIEIQIVGVIIKLVLRDLKDAWRSVMELNPQLEGTETNA
jgi:flagellar motor switch protein FliM